MFETLLATVVAYARLAIADIERLALMTWSWLLTQPIWLGAVLASGTVALIVAITMWIRRRREQARRISTARRRAAAARDGQTTLSLKPRETTRATPQKGRTPAITPATASAAQARELVLHGVPAIEISRRTGLARDAVSLLLTQTGREARKGRPSTAGLAAPMSVSARRGDLDLHA